MSRIGLDDTGLTNPPTCPYDKPSVTVQKNPSRLLILEQIRDSSRDLFEAQERIRRVVLGTKTSVGGVSRHPKWTKWLKQNESTCCKIVLCDCVTIKSVNGL